LFVSIDAETVSGQKRCAQCGQQTCGFESTPKKKIFLKKISKTKNLHLPDGVTAAATSIK